MKPILFTLGALFISLVGYSQRVNYPPAPSSIYVSYGNILSDQMKSTLWSDDISSPANWSFTNSSVPFNDWTVEADSTIVSLSGPFQSTTSSNGFLVFISDTIQNSTSDAYAEYSGAPIDLTGQANVRIQFEQQFISDSNQRTVEVSSDGMTWIPFVISDGLTATGARIDDLASIDISSVAGNASNVLFRFQYSGTQEGYWAIDDIEIRSIDSVDLRAVSVDWGTTGAWGVRMPYYSVVYSQIQPIEFCVVARNDGLLNVDTATYSVSIPVVSFDAVDTFSIQTDEFDTICSTTPFTPTNPGAYQVEQMIVSSSTEQNLINNSYPLTKFNVLDGNWIEYARDDLITGSQGGLTRFGGLGDGWEVGNVFDIFQPDYCSLMEVQLHPSAPENMNLHGKLYRIDSLTGDFILEDQTLDYTVQSWDLGQTIYLNFTGANLLQANTSYLLTVGTYNVSDSSEVIIATSGKSEPNTSFLLHEGWTTQIYYLTETPMVRMMFNPEGLDEYQSNFNFNISPNPANKSTTLSFELPATSKIVFELIDLSGKTVNQIESMQFAEGKNQYSLKTPDLLNGVYFMKFTSDFGSTTKRIVIQH